MLCGSLYVKVLKLSCQISYDQRESETQATSVSWEGEGRGACLSSCCTYLRRDMNNYMGTARALLGFLMNLKLQLMQCGNIGDASSEQLGTRIKQSFMLYQLATSRLTSVGDCRNHATDISRWLGKAAVDFSRLVRRALSTGQLLQQQHKV